MQSPSRSPATAPPPRRGPLRRDAERNRLRILQGARRAFTELGLNASVEEIAACAGVGVGTVYRRFPTKQALVQVIASELLERLERLAREALERPEPGEALRWFLYQLVDLQTANRGVKDVVLAHRGRLPGLQDQVREAHRRTRPAVERLLRRAQEAGQVRDDVVLEDIQLILLSVSSVVEIAGRRLLDLLLDGLRPEGASPLSVPPLTPEQFRRAIDLAWRR